MVFHEAAIPSVPRSIDDPVPSHEVNIDGTFKVLRAAREGGVGRVVYAASSSAYGDTLGAAESGDACCRCRNRPTPCRSWWASITATSSPTCFGLETVALRYFNVYGPRQDPSSPYSGVLSLFMKAILERTGADHLRRRRAVARFHLCGGCGRAEPEGGAGARTSRGKMYNGGNGGRITLNQAWRLLQKFEGVEIAPNTARRAPAMCAIRRPIPPRPCAIWATLRNSVSRRPAPDAGVVPLQE